MQSENQQDRISLQPSSDDEIKDQNQVIIRKNSQKQSLQKMKQDQKISNDSQIDSDDKLSEINSQKQESSESSFQIQGDEILDQDKHSQNNESQEEKELETQIFDMENGIQNQEESQEVNQEKVIQQLKNGPKVRVSLRDYQKTLFQKSQDKNSIIYLPTGLGKTRIAIIAIYYYLSYTQKKKIVFLANTIQLVKQQTQAIKRTLYGIIQNKNLCKQLNKKHGGNQIYLDWSWQRICQEVACIHGQKNEQIGQTKRKKIQNDLLLKKQFLKKFQSSTVQVVISQMFLNSLRRGIIKLTDFSFMVFDQCHHCKGDHPYAGIMNEFYFQIKKKIEKQKKNGSNEIQILPIIMGLTASPISEPEKDDKKLQKKIQQLCINLDSNFAEYPKSDNAKETKIQIIKIQEDQQKSQLPLLLNFFVKHNTHRTSYEKLEYHFPLYFECIKQVIETMSSRHDCLKIDRSIKQIHQAQLYFFYDIKQCLLNKIKDIWLELGQYVMCLAFSDMITQLKNTKGLKHQQNQLLKNDIVNILLKHQKIILIKFEFDKCLEKYFSGKLKKLIELLTPKKSTQDENENKELEDNDLVLVFAFKRRTVQYLNKFFEKYKQRLPQNKKKYFQCTGVTGYSSKIFTRTQNQGQQYTSNPSSQVQEYYIDNKYKAYLEDYNQVIQNTDGVTQKLQNQLNRFKNAKIGKFLLQTQQKYSSQLKKITQFRKKQKRVLISTSVTQEGFDIPGCNKVISFDTPFSMKSFIQIKGRARKQNSIYIIFTTDVNYQEMLTNQQIYLDTINATYQIAINKIAKKQIKAEKKQNRKGYKKVATKGGAILNTNYALQILKIYFTTLPQPNKGYFHFLKTPSVCYRAIIKMPQSDPSGLSWVVGEALQTKNQALKSAAFIAVKSLKKLDLIKDDLRPSKIQQLQDQYELQKYDDLGNIQRDQKYRQIFQKYVQFQEEQIKQRNKRFLRVHFQAIKARQLNFLYINFQFNKIQYEFEKKNLEFPFQLYRISFSNTSNHQFLKDYENSNDIGILTCFNQKLAPKLFTGYQYIFEENRNQRLSFSTVNTTIKLTYKQYKKYQQVHLFLISACQNRQLSYYYTKTQNKPIRPDWKQKFNERTYEIDQKCQYYPILVLLKRKKGQKKEKIYQIDEQKYQKIGQYEKLFKKIYLYYNKPRMSKQIIKFQKNLTDEFNVFSERIKNNQTITLIQSIAPDFVFHKCIIKKKTIFSEQISLQSKKKNAKYNIENRYKKFIQIFDHFKCQNNQVVQRQLWNDYLKQKKLSFFDKGGIKQQQIKSQRFYYLKQFLQYPVSPQTLLKINISKNYVYDGLNSYTKAFSFLNVNLKNIYQFKHEKKYQPMKFKHYQNVILANSDVIFDYLAASGHSKFLKEIGKNYKFHKHQNQIDRTLEKSLLGLNMSNLSISGIQIANQTLNNSNIQNQSFFNCNQQKENFKKQQKQQIQQLKKYEFNPQIFQKIDITDIQKVLTSKTYKHFKGQNYEQFQFIGDVVLKYLSTLQIFCTRPCAQQGQMHIARANIICNANLHKKAILKQVFRYIMSSKNQDPCPPYKINYDQNKVVKQIYKGKNNQYENLGIQKTNSASQFLGYQYIPGKVHADVIEALIGAFYCSSIQQNNKLQACQQLLYVFDILVSPTTKIDIKYHNNNNNQNLPECYKKLQKNIGYSFKHKGLLIQALTHPTFRNTIQYILDDRNFLKVLETTKSMIQSINLSTQKIQDHRTITKGNEAFYERLQFLGDAVLDLIVVQHLYQKYQKGLDQGTLSLLKQAGVSNKSLGLIAVKFDLHALILMDLPELDNLQKQFTKLKYSFDDYIAHPQKLSSIQINEIKLLGDVFQGLVGAILIDNKFNYEQTKKIVWNVIGKYITILTDKQNVKGFSALNFLNDNNYKNCRIVRISQQVKNGKLRYGLVDRKNTHIQECWADNEKDAWDIIIEKIQAKKKGIKLESIEDQD